MSKKINRNVIVTHSQTGTIICLFWDEGRYPLSGERRSKSIRYLDGKISESVSRAVSVLMRNNPNVSMKEGVITLAWSDFDQEPGLFDLIVDAEEPEQAFVSRYVLEG